MTTKPSIGKRLLGVMLAVPMALAGMGIGATTAVAADTVPTDQSHRRLRLHHEAK